MYYAYPSTPPCRCLCIFIQPTIDQLFTVYRNRAHSLTTFILTRVPHLHIHYIGINIFIMAGSNMIIDDYESMPNPRNKGSLHFKGKDIDVFLAKYEGSADRAHLTEFQRCEFVRLYFSKKERRVLDILEGYRCRSWDKLKEELWSLYSSSCASGTLSPYAEKYKPKYDREAKNEFAGHEANGSQASGSQLCITSECGPSEGLCDMCGESPHDISDC